MRFLSRRFIVSYQGRLIELFGGAAGVRDKGLLESALAQPEATFEGQWLHRDLGEMAAAYGFHLTCNHAFVDGNKRIAAVAMGAFLEINGAPLVTDEVALYQVVIAVAEGTMSKTALADWLREQAPPQPTTQRST
ncbi:MAG: type II toxin-antitoxin system death-on-curing family toxin [Oligoflexia bacterium]|nr:type II toxin-antitoxin system death-on-curing family toxin [Oligoflexia bacterium]